MYKKSLSILLSTVLSTTLLFAGCGSTKTSKKGEKTIVKYLTYSAQPDHIQDLENMIEKFETKNPDIDVQYETVGFNDYFTKLQTLAASNTLPDIFEINYENFVLYAAKDKLLDLTDISAKDNTFDEKVMAKGSMDYFKYKDKLYGMPEKFSDVVLFYNKDLFDAAGVEYPNENWTWKDELEAAQKLTNAQNGVWGSYAPIQFWEFYKTIAQNGGAMFDKDGNPTINSKENVQTLQWMKDKITKYHIQPSQKEMSGQKNEDLFKAGKIAMIRTGIWMIPMFKDAPFKWDITLEPGNKNKAHHVFVDGMVASSNTKNPEAAWKFIKFMASDSEVTKLRVECGWDLPAISDKSVTESYLKLTPPENKKDVFKALETGVMPPVIEQEAKLIDILNSELNNVVLGQKESQKALDDAQKQVERLLGK